MASQSILLTLLLFLSSNACIVPVMIHCQTLPIVLDDHVETYIVQVEEPDEGVKLFNDNELQTWHQSFLPNTTLDSGEPRLIYSYRHAISGFAARLTAKEVTAMENKDGFLLALPSETVEIRTTHSPQFLGLSEGKGLWRSSSSGEGMIIGVIDSGIAPKHYSFKSLDNMNPPPNKWRGNCSLGPTLCNNKLIGAMAFKNGQNPSPKDDKGHGSICASIAAGGPVYDANSLGDARGKAQGLAPRAHLAVYKVTYANTPSSEDDALAGIDRAIGDGVDVLSISLGTKASEFYMNKFIISTFSAMMNGIVPCLAAPNKGPKPSSIDNDAPWILTVGASTMDRRIKATLKLGNGMELDGESCNQLENYDSPELDVVYAKDMDCAKTSLQNLDVKGKMVVCMGGGPKLGNEPKGLVVKTNGGVAMIVLNPIEHGYTTFCEYHYIPATHLSHVDGLKVMSYLKTTKNPKASIVFKGTQFGASPSPSIPFYTGRGPSMYNGGIIKPDIVAPGTNILGGIHSYANFTITTGTSLATPHIAGISADLKKNHPDWSPAAIKSAMMTTADVEDLDGNPIVDDSFDRQPASYFAMGAGNVNPEKANDPGLVYDIHPDEYISYLCNMYSTYHVKLIVRKKVDCLDYAAISAAELNYPSIAVTMTKSSGSTMKITRTLTNVGLAEIYNLQIKAPEGVDIIADTSSLAFSSLNEKKSFQLQFTTTAAASGKQLSEGYLIWSSGNHVVRSPISVTYS